MLSDCLWMQASSAVKAATANTAVPASTAVATAYVVDNNDSPSDVVTDLDDGTAAPVSESASVEANDAVSTADGMQDSTLQGLLRLPFDEVCLMMLIF